MDSMKKVIKRIVSGLKREMIRHPVKYREKKNLSDLLDRPLQWATAGGARWLGADPGTDDWGQAWTIRQLERLSLYDRILVDLGPGVSNPVMEYYRRRVRHAYQMDKWHPPVPTERTSVLEHDLEEALPLPDESVHVVISICLFEHLSPEGRQLQMGEIERILRPGGKAFLIMRYPLDPEGRGTEALSREPALFKPGSRITSRLNVREMLGAAPCLTLHGECDSALFPGFDGFQEKRVLKIPGLLTCPLTDLQGEQQIPETQARNIRLGEIAIALKKRISRSDADNWSLKTHGEAGSSGGPRDKEDPEVERLLDIFPSMAGKRILNLLDDGGGLSTALERVGGTVHSCVPDLAAYRWMKKHYPYRKCWVHDLERPWSLDPAERYDLVIALGVLKRLTNPRPFITYVTQFGPCLYIDMPGSPKVREGKFEEEMNLLDMDVKEVSVDARDGRRVCFCERRRDRLSPIIVHVHIPKAAGQAFEAFLKRNFKGRVKLFYPEKPARAQWTRFKRDIYDGSDPLVFSSQSMGVYFPPLIGGRVPLYVSLFRHPYSMILSYIKYIKKKYDFLSAAHKAILPDNLKHMSVEESMHWHVKNGGFFPLPVLELTQGLGLATAKEIVSRFLFAGIVEEMDCSMRLLAEKIRPYGFHLDSVEMPVRNTTDDVDLEGYDFASDKAFAKFAERELREEVAFYEWIRERFEREAISFGI